MLESSATLNSCVTLQVAGSGSFSNTHVPTTCSSLLSIVTSPLSYSLNFHVPLFSSSLNVASFPCGTGDVTLSPFTLSGTSLGAFFFSASGNSIPFVPLLYSYVTLCLFGTNVHSPTKFTSALSTFASTASVVLSWSINFVNFQLPSFAASATSFAPFNSPGFTTSPFFFPVCSSGSCFSTSAFTASGNSLMLESFATLNSCVTLQVAALTSPKSFVKSDSPDLIAKLSVVLD